MKQLDALRAFAVFGVLYHHWVHNNTKPLFFFKYAINWGSMGVDLFYVLSGFLITGILLKNKIEIDNGNETILSSIKTFFFRRALRIIPIYYLTLVVTFVFAITPVRETIWWHICYVSNFYFAQRGSWHGYVSHLWSLSVEEQFYLIWPWLIFLVPRRRLFGILIFVIALAPLFRQVCSMMNANSMFAHVVTLGNMDLFGIGALLSYLKTFDQINTEKAKIYLKLCLTLGGFMFCASLLLKSLGIGNSLGIFYRTFEAFFFCAIINKASNGFEGITGAVLEFKPFLYLGKISYGIYLYHMFVPSFIWKILNALQVSGPKSTSSSFLVYTSATIIIASISWYTIEKPITVIKNKYEESRKIKMNRESLLVGGEN
jgi:peptidoglycan/LPS O-acetylase OafA/YrhL